MPAVPLAVWLMALAGMVGVMVLAVLREPQAFALTGKAFCAYWPGDAGNYAQMAESVLSGRGLAIDGQPNAWREPVPVLYLALCFAVGGVSYWSVLIGQGLLVALAAVLGYRLTSGPFGHRAGLLAALLTVGNVHLLRLSTFPLSETMTYCLIVAVMLAFASWWRHGGTWRLVAVGVLIGLATLSRGTVGLLLPFALLACWRRSRSAAAVLALVAGMTLMPWVVRNAGVYHRFVPLTNKFWLNVYLDNGPWALAEPATAPYRIAWPPEKRGLVVDAADAPPPGPARELWAEGYCRREALRAISAQPGAYLWRCVRRLQAQLSPMLLAMPASAKFLQAVKWVLVIVPGLAGLWRWRREPWLWPASGLVVGILVLHSLVIADEYQRYRLPAEAVLAVTAAGFLAGGRFRPEWVPTDRDGDGTPS